MTNLVLFFIFVSSCIIRRISWHAFIQLSVSPRITIIRSWPLDDSFLLTSILEKDKKKNIVYFWFLNEEGGEGRIERMRRGKRKIMGQNFYLKTHLLCMSRLFDMFNRWALFTNNGKILLGNLCTKVITLLQIRPFQILWENLFLENLSDSKLSSSLHLEPFELFHLIFEVKDNISLLQHLSWMFLNI